MSGEAWRLADNIMTEDERKAQNQQLAEDFTAENLPFGVAKDGSIYRPPFSFVKNPALELK